MVKMGMDDPDDVYMTARISGVRNTVHFLGFGSQAGGYGRTGNLQPTGTFDASRIETAEKGRPEASGQLRPQLVDE